MGTMATLLEPIYDIRYLTSFPELDPAIEYTVYEGIPQYQCLIPTVECASIENINVDPQELEHRKSEAQSLIHRFHDHYASTINMITLQTGYWHYILQFGRSFHQIHLEPSNNPTSQVELPIFQDAQVTQSYRLCKFSNNDEIELVNAKNGRRFTNQRVLKGQECDITMQDRVTTFEYTCNPKAEIPILKSVKEWRTCEYIVEIESNWFCQGSAWDTGKQKEKVDIFCVNSELPEKLQLSQISVIPFSRQFLFATHPETPMQFLLATNSFSEKLYVQSEEEISEVQKILEGISFHFQKLVRKGKLLSPRNEVVQTWDTLKYALPIYENGVWITDTVIELDGGITKAHFDDDLDMQGKNWISFEQNPLLHLKE